MDNIPNSQLNNNKKSEDDDVADLESELKTNSEEISSTMNNKDEDLNDTTFEFDGLIEEILSAPEEEVRTLVLGLQKATDPKQIIELLLSLIPFTKRRKVFLINELGICNIVEDLFQRFPGPDNEVTEVLFDIIDGFLTTDTRDDDAILLPVLNTLKIMIEPFDRELKPYFPLCSTLSCLNNAEMEKIGGFDYLLKILSKPINSGDVDLEGVKVEVITLLKRPSVTPLPVIFRTIVEVLRDPNLSASLAIACCRFLQDKSDDASKKVAVEEGVCEIIPTLLPRFSSNHLLTISIFSIIRNLAVDPNNNVKFGACGTCEILIALPFEEISGRALLCYSEAVCNLALNDANRALLNPICERFVKLLDEKQNDANYLVESIIGAIRNLACYDKNRLDLGRAGVCQLLTKILNGSFSATSATLCCWAICNLAAIQENQTEFGQPGCEALIRVLKLHDSNPEFCFEALGAIKNLGVKPENRSALGELGICQMVMKILNELGLRSPKVAVEGLWVIRNLSLLHLNNVEFGKYNLGETMVKVMSRWEDSRDICLQGFWATRNVASYDANCQDLGQAGMCELINRIAVSLGTSTTDMALGCCGAICNLALSESNRALLGQTACDAVAELLRMYSPTSLDVSLSGCGAIRNLALNFQNNMFLGPSCQLVVSILHQYGETSTEIAIHGLWAVCNLSSIEQNQAIFGERGCEVAANILSKYKESQDVCFEGCGAIKNLACNPQNRIFLGDFGACNIIADILSRFGMTSSKVAVECSWAVRNLSCHPRNKAEFAERGVLEQLTKVLDHFGSVNDLAIQGCWAVRNLAIGNCKNQATLINDGICEILAKFVEEGRPDLLKNLVYDAIGSLCEFKENALLIFKRADLNVLTVTVRKLREIPLANFQSINLLTHLLKVQRSQWLRIITLLITVLSTRAMVLSKRCSIRLLPGDLLRTLAASIPIDGIHDPL